MRKNRVLCITGDSGSGKTTLMKFIESLGVRRIITYTTRPQRKGEQDGTDYHFLRNMPDYEGVFLRFSYGNYQYWSMKEDFIGECVITVDETGLAELMKIALSGDIEITTIRLESPKRVENDRIKRDEHRVQFSKEVYDHIVTNDGTLEDLERAGLDIFRLWKRG